jgi:hypothetical protein
MVEAGFQQSVQEIVFRQAFPVRQQSGDLSLVFSDLDQLTQVRPQGGFAAGENDLRNSSLPGFLQDDLPFFGQEFAFNAFNRCRVWIFFTGLVR